MKLKSQGINFKVPYLINIIVMQEVDGESIIRFKKDSVLVRKGINHLSHEFSVELPKEENENQVIQLKLGIGRPSVKKKEMEFSEYTIPLPEKLSLSSELTDSSIHFLNVPEDGISILFDVYALDSNAMHEAISHRLKKDSVLNSTGIIRSKPFLDRKIIYQVKENENELFNDSIFYKKGIFSNSVEKEEDIIVKDEKESEVDFSGELFIESNFFNEKPVHSNAAQYPYTNINANNNINLMGMPFQLNLSHTTNDNISPDFRNFFSFRFDVNQYRNNIQKELLEKAAEKQYTPGEINSDILQNKVAIEELDRVNRLMKQYPKEDVNVDQFIGDELNLANKSAEMDLNHGLDSLFGDSIPSNQNALPSDSALNDQRENIKRVEKAIQVLKQSNQKKEKYLNYIKQKPSAELGQGIDPQQLYQQLPSNHPAAVLSRFEKFELGNFYEYAGQYSIRDVEMKGVNASFLLNAENKVGLLHGRINDFQSFNLDRIEASKRISSAAISNRSLDYFQPGVRITHFNDESINEELIETSPSYYVISAQAMGELGGLLFYEAEINQSNDGLKLSSGSESKASKNLAYYTNLTITPAHFLDLKLQYDQVGSNYRSDGVYFLNRNRQTTTIGYKLRLFKNKIHFKNDYTIINRNFEQKSLSNQTKKLYFDMGTHFKRLPNVQLTYSPISVDIANKIDTSFSGIDANTNVLIARVFYFKKVRKTLYNTALIYSEIQNDFSEGFSTQRGVQHLMSISNEKLSVSLTSSFKEVFQSLRFLSANYQQALNEKLNVNLSIAKNFADDFYSEIIRSGISYQLPHNIKLGAGAIFLVEDSKHLNTGGSLSIRWIY